MNKQFVSIPSINLEEVGLEMRDLVIYAYLKKHYNIITKESHPSIDLLVEESGISKPTVLKCINRLQNSGYINIIRRGKFNKYSFSDIKKFEIYSFDFLDKKDLSTMEKAYIICMQPHMFKDSELGIGKITYSELDIAKSLNIDLRTLRKYESHLQQGDRPIMTLVPTKKKDPITGLAIQERVFDFDAYNNLLALKFSEVDQRLDEVSKKQDQMILQYQKRITELEKEVALLKRGNIQEIVL